ncbi:MAG TPA: pilus assembly PilX N-terminal domain-containing protein, partial [Thermoanaerobaculia bacterium]|nr:pilus assembly PilX N-terminal domain-containing protein [Thermoanaerobaculia bacterium]
MPESRPHPAASSTSARPGERSSAESGMAYVIAVAVLAVLTILGVSLVLVTQAEVVSGGQERTMEKTFYGAEAGLQLSVARALAEGDFSPSVHERASTGLASGELTEIRDRVETSTFICQGEIPCDLCAINQGRSFAR